MSAPENKKRLDAWCLFSVILACFVIQVTAIQAEEARFGLEKRVPWTTSRVTGTPDPALPYETERAFPQLKFNQPLAIATAPGEKRFFVAERRGKIFSFNYEDQQASQADLFFDLKVKEPALNEIYGITFHPRFAENRYVYICYVLKPGLPEGTRVSRFKVLDTDPPRCDPASEEILIEWLSGGHNGGCLRFGPDGYLYISTGDGGPASPPDIHNAGQDVSNLLSCILRIDVDQTGKEKPYAVPADNPFVDRANAKPEIYAYGLRNVWRLSFDPKTKTLYAGDVGQDLWEEVNIIKKGGNYGWSVREGTHNFGNRAQTAKEKPIDPVWEYDHGVGRSITGGIVYRGQRLPELDGLYVYADFVSGKIWALEYDEKTSEVTKNLRLAASTVPVMSFGTDEDGELYYTVQTVKGGEGIFRFEKK